MTAAAASYPEEEHELAMFYMNANKRDIETAFAITETFIKTQPCLLSGGMGIDFALKLKGSSLYGENAIPDYDPWTVNHLDMSEQLGKIICDAGIDNVFVQGALHATTRRVAIMSYAICELTHMPANLYAQVPTLVYNGITFRHPHHQIIDMFRSLSHLQDGFPYENYMDRLAKDTKRGNILLAHYPFEIGKTTLKSICTENITANIPLEWGDFCVGGIGVVCA